MASRYSSSASGSTPKRALETGFVESPPNKRMKHALNMDSPSFSNPSEMVTFLVGKVGEEEKFKVHKEFACYYSPMLHAAFNGNFEEGRTQTYHIEDIRPGAFRILVRWLYSQKLSAPPTEKSNVHQEIAKLEDLDLIQLWVIADRLLIPRLQNCTIKTLAQIWGKNKTRDPIIEWIPYAYEHTLPGSPLRKLAVDLAVFKHLADDIEDNEEIFRQNFPSKMLFDMFKVFSTAIKPRGASARTGNPSYRSIVDEEGKYIYPGEGEDFFEGEMFVTTRTTRSYLVPEDD